MLVWPNFNPIALQIGPLAIRWYGLSYVLGMAGGLFFGKRVAKRNPFPLYTALNSANIMDDAFIWVVLGIILGGRLGYILFYGLSGYLAHPLSILEVWHGGMSFHGGMLGVALALWLFSRRYAINVFDLTDRVAPVVTIGLGLGRLANFINGELWGKPVMHPDRLPWAMVFPQVDALPRHPSQLYEAGLEGLLLGAVLTFTLLRTPRGLPLPRYLNTGIFLVGYALCRIFAEIFRVPEIIHSLPLPGLPDLFISQGQTLCLPMLAAGLFLMYLDCHDDAPAPSNQL